MNRGVKYPHKKLFRISNKQNTALTHIAAHLTEQRRRRAVSEGTVIRLMIDHCANCDIFLRSVSIEQNISTD